MEIGAGAARERLLAYIGRSELGEEVVSPFQVEPDDLLLLDDPLPQLSLKPISEPLVELSSGCFRDGLVRRVTDQEVPERQGLDILQIRALRPDELLPHERRELVVPDASSDRARTASG